ncbi:hypothetical protein BH09ACT4_BH09ACT4_19600 [soil metagenome]
MFSRSTRLSIAAATISLLSVAVHDLPAQAATVERDAFEAASQQLTASVHTFAPVATREDFIVTRFTTVQWPVAPNTDVSSGFGLRIAPCWGCSSDHQGVDFDPGEGTAIHVVADGVVVESALEAGGLGQHVVVEHNIDGKVVQTVYGHMILGSQTVRTGDKVKMGEIIGLVGSTGASTGAHLHFEVRPGGVDAIEPLHWLKKNVTQTWVTEAAAS